MGNQQIVGCVQTALAVSHPTHPPVQGDGSEVEHGDGAEEPLQELHSLADEGHAQPLAA